MSENVFAYGSNMCSGRFLDYGVIPLGRGRAAVLKDFRLCFNKKSKDGSGKANVEPRLDEKVWGVVYVIPDEHLQILDSGEGAGYQREKVSVELADGGPMDAWVFFAVKPSRDSGLRPYTWYRRFLVEGAREHSLPELYIEELESIAADEDPNRERDEIKRALLCRS